MKAKILVFCIAVVILVSGCKKEDITYNVSISPLIENGTATGQTGAVAEGTSITFTATPAENYEFVAWGNLLTGEQYTSNPLTITVDEDLNLVPIFRRIEYRLTLNTEGSGSVSLENLEAGQSGTGPFFGAGTRIRLTATPEQGHIFQNWNTNLADTTAIKEVTVDGNLNLTANFNYELAQKLVGSWDIDLGGASSKANFNRLILTIDYGLNCYFQFWNASGQRTAFVARIFIFSNNSFLIGNALYFSQISFSSNQEFSGTAAAVTQDPGTTPVEANLQVGTSLDVNSSATQTNLDYTQEGLLEPTQASSPNDVSTTDPITTVVSSIVSNSINLPRIQPSELAGNWNVRELYSLDANDEIQQIYSTPNCGMASNYFEFLANNQLSFQQRPFSLGGTTCTGSPSTVVNTSYTLKNEGNIIAFSHQNTNTQLILIRPLSNNTLIVKIEDNGTLRSHQDQSIGFKLVREARFMDYDGDGMFDDSDPDDDNDTYSDVLENELGSNPKNANSIPDPRAISVADLQGNWNVINIYDLDSNSAIQTTYSVPACAEPYMFYTFQTNSNVVVGNRGLNSAVSSCTANPTQNTYAFSFASSNTHLHWSQGQLRILSRTGTNVLVAQLFDGQGNAVGTPPRAYRLVKEDRLMITDLDGDGIANEFDTDDDNDGVSDADEATAGTDPLDATSFPDFDGDGIADPTDTDDDNDGYSDQAEQTAGTNPKDASSFPQTNTPPPTPSVSFDLYSNFVNTVTTNGCQPIPFGSRVIYYKQSSLQTGSSILNWYASFFGGSTSGIQVVSTELIDSRFSILSSVNTALSLYELNFWYNNDNDQLLYVQLLQGSSIVNDYLISNYASVAALIADVQSDLSQNAALSSYGQTVTPTLQDGIYRSTGLRKQTTYTNSEQVLDCQSYGQYSWQNHLSENGVEYFLVQSGQLTGYILYFPSETQSTRVWDLTDFFYTNDLNGEFRSLLGLQATPIDSFVQSDRSYTNPLTMHYRSTMNGQNIRAKTLLEKINTSDLPFTAVNNFQGIGFYADPVYSQLDINDPASYLTVFIQDASRYGVDLSAIDPNNYTFNIIPDSQWTAQAVAYASRVCDDNRIEITYKQSAWNEHRVTDYSVDIPLSMKVMWHEFGHDILNLQHVCLGDHIMSGRHQNPQIIFNANDCNTEYITLYGMGWDNLDPKRNFQRAVQDMFNGTNQAPFNCSGSKGTEIIY